MVDLGDDTTLCYGSSRVLKSNPFSSVVWQDGSTNTEFTVTDAGLYNVSVTDNNECSAKDTIRISTILPAPSGFLKPYDSICGYGSLQLYSLYNYEHYKWNTGETAPSISITNPGVYWLQVIDKNRCIGSDSMIIYPKECLKGFHIPNAFTPNNDQLNDTFKPYIGGAIKNFQFTVYNRWGQTVFSTNNIDKAWDGTVKGVMQNTGVFMWTCTYQTEGNEKNVEKGTVLLIR